LKEREKRLKKMKYENRILRMNIAKMCPEDKTQYGPIQEETGSRYRQGYFAFGFDKSLVLKPLS